MFKKAIKTVFSTLGLRISKIPKQRTEDERFYLNREVSPFEWLREYNFSTIIDIGSNEGQFVEKIIEVFPNAKIFCFEPIKSVFNALVVKFGGLVNFKAFNYGLGDIEEEKAINLNEYSPSSSMLEMLELHKSNFDFAIKTEPTFIKLKKLDDVFDVILDGPVLLKIDVQGYEMNVIKGGERILANANVVIIETTFVPLYKNQPLFADIYEYFISNGFKYAGNVEQLISPRNYQILQADAVFIKA